MMGTGSSGSQSFEFRSRCRPSPCSSSDSAGRASISPAFHFASMDKTKFKVILQISSTAIPESRLNEYLRDVQSNELRSYELAPGLDSVCLLQRAFVAYVEVVIMSIWRSEKALERFSDSWPSRDRVASEYGGIQFEPRVYSLMMFCKGITRDIEFE